MRSVHWTTCLAVAAALLASGPDVSATEQVVLEGRSCGFDVAEVSPGMYTGHVTGGPVYAGTARRPVAGVYLLCTIQVNAPNHAGPDTSLTTAWGVGSASVPPAPVSFRAMPGDTVSTCTEIWIDTSSGHVTVVMTGDGNVFVDLGNDDPRCSEQTNVGGNPFSVDGLVCPILADLADDFPPSGPLAPVIYLVPQAGDPAPPNNYPGADVYIADMLFWDCPAYTLGTLTVAPEQFSDTVAVAG